MCFIIIICRVVVIELNSSLKNLQSYINKTNNNIII